MITENDPEVQIIFEDDALVNRIEIEDIKERIKSLPDDWMIYLLGIGLPLKYEIAGTDLYKIKRFYGLHGYVINLKGANYLSDKMFPIQQQLDSHLSELSMDYELKVYMHKYTGEHAKSLVKLYRSPSDIQTNINEDKDSYARLPLKIKM